MDPESNKTSNGILTTPACPTKATSNLNLSLQTTGHGPSGCSLLASTGDDFSPFKETLPDATHIAFSPVDGTPYEFMITDKHGNSCSRLALEVSEGRSLITANLVQDLGAGTLPLPPSITMKSQPTLTGIPLENFAAVKAYGSKTTGSYGRPLSIGILEHGLYLQARGIDAYIGERIQGLLGKITMLQRAGSEEVNGTGNYPTDRPPADIAHQSPEGVRDTSILTLSSASVDVDDPEEVAMSQAFHGPAAGGLLVPSTGTQCLNCLGSLPAPNSFPSNSAGGGTLYSRCEVQQSSPPTSIEPDNKSLCSCESSASVIDSEAPDQVTGGLQNLTHWSVVSSTRQRLVTDILQRLKGRTLHTPP